MRKIISLGLFALMLSMFSSQVFAGKIAVCEDIKNDPAYKGLYGLCNAYWNADDAVAQAKVLANFEKKAGTDSGGPGMPGLITVVCPCWDMAQVEALSDSASAIDDCGTLINQSRGTDFDFLNYVGDVEGVDFHVELAAGAIVTGFSVCTFTLNGNRTGFPINDDEEVECRGILQVVEPYCPWVE